MTKNASSPAAQKPAGAAFPHKWAIASDWRGRLALFFIILLTGVALDQATKRWAQSTLARVALPSQLPQVEDSERPKSGVVHIPTRRIKVVPGLFDLLYVENSAAAFSLTESLPAWLRIPFLMGISIVAVAAFLWWYFTLKQAGWSLLASFCLVIAGAVGNLLDRATLGYVIDFFHLHAGFVGHANIHWPTFNVADIIICVGAAGILLHTIREDSSAPSSEKISVS